MIIMSLFDNINNMVIFLFQQLQPQQGLALVGMFGQMTDVHIIRDWENALAIDNRCGFIATRHAIQSAILR